MWTIWQFLDAVATPNIQFSSYISKEVMQDIFLRYLYLYFFNFWTQRSVMEELKVLTPSSRIFRGFAIFCFALACALKLFALWYWTWLEIDWRRLQNFLFEKVKVREPGPICSVIVVLIEDWLNTGILFKATRVIIRNCSSKFWTFSTPFSLRSIFGIFRIACGSCY